MNRYLILLGCGLLFLCTQAVAVRAFADEVEAPQAEREAKGEQIPEERNAQAKREVDEQFARLELPDNPTRAQCEAFVAELDEAANAIAQGRPSSILGGELARDAVILCHCQTESVKQGKPVSVS